VEYRFRLLTHSVQVRLPDPSIGDQLELLASVVDQQAVPALQQTSYAVRMGDEGVELLEDGALFVTVSSMDEALLTLDARLRRRVVDLAARSGWLPLRAGVAIVAGGTCLLVGGSPGQRAVLLVGLLAEGAEVVGGDVALVRDGVAIGYPRPLWLAPAAAGIECLRPWLGALPRLRTGDGPVLGVDPARVGRASPLEAGAVRGVILMEPDGAMGQGGDGSSAATLRTLLAARIDTAARPRAADVAEISQLVREVPTVATRTPQPGGSVSVLAARLAELSRATG
jgi:hypothetical protein